MTSQAKIPHKNRLHLGCGLTTPDGWINIDGSWNARLAKYPILRRVAHSLHLVPPDKVDVPWSSRIFIHDVRKPLPFPNGSAEAIYSSHLLEHLYFEQGKTLVRECFRVLASKGILRVVVPDLACNCPRNTSDGTRLENPSTGDESLTPADRFNQRLLMRPPAPPSDSLIYRWYTTVADFHQHKWMYDENSLKALLRAAGFADVERMPLHTSRIAGIEQIEQPSRVANGQGICVEGVKP